MIVTWDATEEAVQAAESENIEIWYFPKMLKEIAEAHQKNKAYLIDDTARTIQLFAMADEWCQKNG